MQSKEPYPRFPKIRENSLRPSFFFLLFFQSIQLPGKFNASIWNNKRLHAKKKPPLIASECVLLACRELLPSVAFRLMGGITDNDKIRLSQPDTAWIYSMIPILCKAMTEQCSLKGQSIGHHPHDIAEQLEIASVVKTEFDDEAIPRARLRSHWGHCMFKHATARVLRDCR